MVEIVTVGEREFCGRRRPLIIGAQPFRPQIALVLEERLTIDGPKRNLLFTPVDSTFDASIVGGLPLRDAPALRRMPR